MKTKTTVSIYGFLLLLIPLIACSSSNDITDEQEPVFLSPADIGEQFGDAVWEVSTDACGTDSGGSSFAIAPNIFITNEHVIGPDMTPTLISRNGETLEGVVIGKDKDLDVAVVQISEPVGLWLEWADPNELREGDPVVSLGYPAPYYSFSVAPGSIITFIPEGSRRIGVVSDEASDFGSSGGPLVSENGQVVGVVTQYVEEVGAQLNGESFTYTHLGSFIERSVQEGTAITENCDGFAYGTNVIGDYFWDLCSDLNAWACDSLFELDLFIPVGGDYTNFGATCGDQVEIDVYCIEYFDSPYPIDYGDNVNLDVLHDECLEGIWDSCDILYFASQAFPDAGDYYQIAATCGNTVKFDSMWCGSYVMDLVDP